jgi:hypothetical protein
MPSTRTLCCAALLLAASPVGAAQTPPAAPARQAAPLLGDQTDGSRARPVHRIPLRDPEGEVIRTTDRPLLPFSTARTCGADCHDVATIGRGWHFSAATTDTPPGRPSEPWILVDADTATQLPVSDRRWPGTYRPGDVGLTPWKFAKMFGGRTPGGLSASHEPTWTLRARWAVSGELEVNCLACHDGSAAYDHGEYGRQIAQENFRWAPTAASSMAGVTGSAKEMPNTYDYLLPVVEDDLRDKLPTVAYADSRFMPDAKVVFDVVREVPARRCYFCHSTVDVERTGQGRWNADVDIHLARGMTCVDCHRHGLDHRMTRGYDGDPAAAVANAAAVSCRGCHLAGESDRVFSSGRLGAPYPTHQGLPPIHLQKFSCTACHSGPAPGPTVRRLKTSQAHRLGGLAVNKAADVLPHLYYPVFAKQADGTTTVNRLMWPAFWGAMANQTITPLAPDDVKRVMVRAKVTLPRSVDGSWPQLNETTLVVVLRLLAGTVPVGNVPVYVAGGLVRRVDQAGKLVADAHEAAAPYIWPMAHDVRPAAVALGARGCQDCHDAGAPLLTGQVTVDSPLVSDRQKPWPMARFQRHLDVAYLSDFAWSFRYRPWLKASVSAAGTVLLLFVLAYAIPAAGALSRATMSATWIRFFINAAGAAGFAGIAATGYPALVSGKPLTGYRLMLHVGTAPVFVACAVLMAWFWAHRNRLGVAEWNRLRRPIGAAATHAATPYLALLRKLTFWVAVLAVFPSVVSVTLAMFPVLPSVYQGDLLAVHRYSAWVLVVSAALFALCALVAWVRRYPDEPAPEPPSGS